MGGGILSHTKQTFVKSTWEKIRKKYNTIFDQWAGYNRDIAHNKLGFDPSKIWLQIRVLWSDQRTLKLSQYLLF